MNPALCSSSRSPSPPTTSTVDPAGTRPLSNRTAACGEVTTSSAATVSPRLVRCWATDALVRDALLVM